MNAPRLIAHRGYAKHYPENTLIGIEAALQAGACFVEFDVQLTADGVPVLCHDDTLVRTAGVEQSVLSLKLNQLAAIHVNESARLGGEFNDVPIPTLAQITALLQRWPHATAFVELKEESLKAFGIENTVKAVLRVLEPVRKQCIIISYDRLAIRVARAMGGHAIGWVLHKWGEDTRAIATELAPNYLFCNYTRIPADQPLWPGPWQWVFYEVTNPEIAMMLGKRGAALIETMAIGEMLKYPPLRKRGCFASEDK